MKNLKKLMSVILTVAMLMSLVVSTSAATFADVAEDNNAYEAIEVLAALDILEGKDANNFDPDANIKRSEFAAVVCRAMNAEAAAAGSASDKFSDVPANHWAAGYIAWAADAKIVNGRGDGTFDPDANVTYQEAAKMVVAALGFGPYAENKGGFPTGYMVVANNYNLMSGIKADSYTVAADRKGVAQLVYNAFDAPLMDTSKISFGDDAEYEIYDGKDAEKRTLLSQYHDIYKIKATVADTYRTAPSSLIDAKGNRSIKLTVENLYKFDAEDLSDALNKTVAKDSNLTVLDGGIETADLMGYTVNAYVALNDDDKAALVAIVADGSSVDELVIDNPGVYLYSVGNEIKYWEDLDDDKPAKAELATKVVDGATVLDVDVYKNGAAASDIAVTLESLSEYNKIVLVGEDEVYNKIMLTKYEYGLVEEIDAEVYELTLDNGAVINLDAALREEAGDPFYVNIYKDGAAIDFEDIAEGDLLNVVSDVDIDNSEEWMFADIYVTNNVVEGSVETVDEGEEAVYTIDGEEYYIAADAAISSLNPGDAGSFILTIDGKIYDADLTQVTTGNYAFILAVGIKAGDFAGEGDVLQLKLVDKNNKTAIYTVADNAYIAYEWEADNFYGKTTDEEDQADLAAALGYDAVTKTETIDVENLAARMVTFKANEDKVISNLTFANADADSFNVATLNANYKKVGNRLGAYNLLDATVVFNAPVEEGALNVNKVQVYSASSLKEKEEGTYTGYVFDVNADREIGAVLVNNAMAFAGAENALAVVKSISTGLDAEGYSTQVLNLFQAGETKAIAKANDGYLGGAWNFTAGDVVQYTTNAAGEINDIKVVLDVALTEDGKTIVVDGASVAFASDGSYDYAFAAVSEIKSSYIDLVGGASYGFDLAEDGTNVLIDTTKTLKSAMSEKNGTSYLKAAKTYAGETTTYYVLAKVEDDMVVELVSYKVVTAAE